jgi:hypothetical protein
MNCGGTLSHAEFFSVRMHGFRTPPIRRFNSSSIQSRQSRSGSGATSQFEITIEEVLLMFSVVCGTNGMDKGNWYCTVT